MWDGTDLSVNAPMLVEPGAIAASAGSDATSNGSVSVRHLEFTSERAYINDVKDDWSFVDADLYEIEQEEQIEERALGWRGFAGATLNSSHWYLPIPTVDADIQERDISKTSSRGLSRYEIFRFQVKSNLEDPTSSFAGYVVEYCMICAIFTSVSCAVAETVPGVGWRPMFISMELAFTLLFSVEIAARFWVSDSVQTYFSDWFNIIDICSTLPGYSELLVPLIIRSNAHEKREAEDVTASMQSLRLVQLVKTIRLLRVLRLAKVMRRSESLVVVVKSIWGSLRGLGVLVAFVLLGTVISATVCFFFETGTQDTEFTSIPASIWWAASTIMAVGYGDIVPQSVAGKITAMVTMLVGTVIMAVCIAVITSSFTELYARNLYMARARSLQAKISGLKRQSTSSPEKQNSANWRCPRDSLSIFMTDTTFHGKPPIPGQRNSSPCLRSDIFDTQGDMNFADVVNQLDDMTENLLVGIENLISRGHSFNESNASLRAPPGSERRCATLTLENLRKTSKLWFEQVRSLSEELLQTKAEELEHHLNFHEDDLEFTPPRSPHELPRAERAKRRNKSETDAMASRGV